MIFGACRPRALLRTTAAIMAMRLVIPDYVPTSLFFGRESTWPITSYQVIEVEKKN